MSSRSRRAVPRPLLLELGRLFQFIQSRGDHPADYGQAERAALVYRVLRGVPVTLVGAVIEVDDIDGGNSGVDKGNVVVLNVVWRGIDEIFGVAEKAGIGENHVAEPPSRIR